MNVFTQRLIAIFSILMMLLALCLVGSSDHPTVNKAVYNWKTNFERSSYGNRFTDSFLSRHQIRTMYVKMLDIDYSPAAGIFPANKTSMDYYMNKNEDSMEYIPVVYITNQVLRNLPFSQAEYYAKQILVQALRLETHTGKIIREVQIDCDWTQETRDSYFTLLKYLKKWGPQFKYSVTLRLYPFKYRDEMGIPPVDKVMLMVYNIENAKQFRSRNSIFTVQEAAKYLNKKSYPLPMDFALPAFSWTLVFRNQQFLKVVSENIIPEIKEPQYVGDVAKVQLQLLEPNVYLVKEASSGYQPYDLRAGDILKVESCGEKELLEARLLISRFQVTSQTTIALFDLDENDLRRIPHEKIEAAFAIRP